MVASGEGWGEGIVREFGKDMYTPGFSGSASGKEPACQCRRCKRVGLDPQVRKIPGEGHGNPLQYSCLENNMDRGAWQATVHGFAKELDTHDLVPRQQHSVLQHALYPEWIYHWTLGEMVPFTSYRGGSSEKLSLSTRVTQEAAEPEPKPTSV